MVQYVPFLANANMWELEDVFVIIISSSVQIQRNDSAHLIYQVKPSDTKADETALNEAKKPNLREIQPKLQTPKRKRVFKSLETQVLQNVEKENNWFLKKCDPEKGSKQLS